MATDTKLGGASHFHPNMGTTINATHPLQSRQRLTLALTQRAWFRNALQSFRIIAPVIIWFNTGDLIDVI